MAGEEGLVAQEPIELTEAKLGDRNSSGDRGFVRRGAHERRPHDALPHDGACHLGKQITIVLPCAEISSDASRTVVIKINRLP